MITAIVERLVDTLDTTRREEADLEDFEFTLTNRQPDSLSGSTDYLPDSLEDTEHALTEFALATL